MCKKRNVGTIGSFVKRNGDGWFEWSTLRLDESQVIVMKEKDDSMTRAKKGRSPEASGPTNCKKCNYYSTSSEIMEAYCALLPGRMMDIDVASPFDAVIVPEKDCPLKNKSYVCPCCGSTVKRR